MERNVFAPKLPQQPVNPESTTELKHSKSDAISRSLLGFAQISIIALAFLLPLFFWPGLSAGLDLTKVLLGVAAVGVVTISLSLLALRTITVRTVLPGSLLLFWGVTVAAFVSGLFSADSLAAFRGSVLETQTVTFLGLLAMVATVGLLAQHNKRFMTRILQAFLGGAIVALVYVVVRLLAGPILGFNSFSVVTASPIGNFNDTAVFAGLLILLATITLLQVSVSKLVQGLFTAVVGLALFVLAVVNFFYVWVVIGFFGLMVLLYIVAQDTLFAAGSQHAGKQAVSKVVIAVSLLICLTSAAFVIAGDYIGTTINTMLGVEYLEVRPSLQATIDIAQNVYQEDALFGVGPNQFVSSWRDFKDPSINQTIFWNTDFRAGSGYVPTLFVTLGLVGGLLLVIFHMWYMWNMARMLLKPAVQDSYWYYLAIVTFTGTVFLWGMSYVYVPSATILLLAALFTGLSLATGFVLQPKRIWNVPLVTNRQRGFVLMAITIICITSTMGAWFTFGKQYVAQTTFNNTQAQTDDIAMVDQAALAAYQLYPDHRFLGVRAQIALREMNQVLTITEPSESDQQRFLEISDRALILTDGAIAAAPKEPTYRAILAGVYNNLALAGVPGALGRATSSIVAAAALDPQNPVYALMTAQLAANRGDAAAVRSALTTALLQKRNYTQALFALAQLDIAEGNVTGAIETTQAIITLEPNNPARYYQLGILFSSNGDVPAAAAAYQAALRLDSNFANARYLLALLQLEAGAQDDALANLEFVLESNAENEQLRELVVSLRAGDIPVLPESGIDVPVSDAQPTAAAETVTSPSVPESDLLTPLNTVFEAEPTAVSTVVPTEAATDQEQSEVE